MKTKKTLIIYGLIGGAITVIGFFLWPVLDQLFSNNETGTSDYDLGELIGYIAMIIALSTVFFGLRKYRAEQGGQLTFWDGFTNGLITVFIASILYVVGWMIYYPIYAPNFPEEYLESQITQFKSEELSPEELQLKIDDATEFMIMYKKPVVMAGFSFLEIFPIGLVVVLISAIILRRNSENRKGVASVN